MCRGAASEAARRRHEAEAAKAELARKIACTRQRSVPDEAPAAQPPPEPVAAAQPPPALIAPSRQAPVPMRQRSRTPSDLQSLPETEEEEADVPPDAAADRPAASPRDRPAAGEAAEDSMQARAAAKVDRAFAATAATRDVAGFMRQLGYAAPPSRGPGDGAPALLRCALC